MSLRKQRRTVGVVIASESMGRSFVSIRAGDGVTGFVARKASFMVTWSRPTIAAGLGRAEWGPRHDALVMRFEEAVAAALVVSELAGSEDAVLLDAQTLERVDSASWVPKTRQQARELGLPVEGAAERVLLSLDTTAGPSSSRPQVRTSRLVNLRAAARRARR